MPVRAWLIAWLMAVTLAAGSAAAQSDVRLVDLDGREFSPWEAHPAAASVFIFTMTECPISNRYAPEIARLYRLFEPRGVAFWLVYVDDRDTVDQIHEHVESFGYPMTATRDPHHALVRLAGATVTPEVAVFDANRELRYRGRIDDRYVAFGKSRPQPSRRDLSMALDALLAGGPVAAAETTAIGCYIPAPGMSHDHRE